MTGLVGQINEAWDIARWLLILLVAIGGFTFRMALQELQRQLDDLKHSKETEHMRLLAQIEHQHNENREDIQYIRDRIETATRQRGVHND